MNETCRQSLVRSLVALAAAVAGLAAAFLFPAPALARGATSSFANSRARLERMTRQQRLQTWERHAEFLRLPTAEQERMRRLSADLEALSPAQRDRYKTMMERYRKWRDGLPLYQRQRLEDAAAQGSVALYNTLREVQKDEELDDQQRPYWLLPDRLRAVLPKIFAKLSAEQIEQLDGTSPLDRGEKLLEFAQQMGLGLPAPINGPRPRLRGPLPPVNPDKLLEFRQKLSKQQLDDLGDLGRMKPIQRQRLLEWYYDRHPEELPEGFRRGEQPMGPRNPADRMSPKKDGPGADGRSRGSGDRKD